MGYDPLAAQASGFTITQITIDRLRREVFVTEAELKKHLDAAEKSPKEIAAAVLGLPEKTLHHKPAPGEMVHSGDSWTSG